MTHSALSRLLAVFCAALLGYLPPALAQTDNPVPGLTQDCTAGDAYACSELGRHYESGEFVPADDINAAGLYRIGCETGDVAGCTDLGYMYERGRGVPQDDAVAVSYYRQGCDGGDSLGCSNLGSMYDGGFGIPEDNAEAVRLFGLACDDGMARGCSNLGLMYRDAEGVPEDLVQAARYYKLGLRPIMNARSVTIRWPAMALMAAVATIWGPCIMTGLAPLRMMAWRWTCLFRHVIWVTPWAVPTPV